jgi:hypothetical protein
MSAPSYIAQTLEKVSVLRDIYDLFKNWLDKSDSELSKIAEARQFNEILQENEKEVTTDLHDVFNIYLFVKSAGRNKLYPLADKLSEKFKYFLNMKLQELSQSTNRFEKDAFSLYSNEALDKLLLVGFLIGSGLWRSIIRK